jgi:hypothetical protein
VQWDPFQKLDWIWTHVSLELQCNSNEGFVVVVVIICQVICGGKVGRENKQRLKTYKLSRY